MASTHLLGPQRFLTTAGAVVRGLDVDGPVATITAGWEERESADDELDSVMDGRSLNLRLFERMMDVLERDTVVAEAALALRDAVDDLAGAYGIRLHHALDSVYALRRRKGREDVLAAAYSDGIDAVRRLDQWYLDELRALYGEAYASGAAGASELWAQHRGEVAEALAGSSVLAVAGGHVGMLLRTMQFFSVRPPTELPVVAWSAGAMVMTRTVVLFNDFAQVHPGAEVWDRGLARVEHVIALPHARRRIHLDDRVRTQTFVRRFEGYACLLLDDGARVEVGPDGALPAGARVLRADGTVGVVEDAA
ncbi:MAG TPA: Type 1 glutamine amidotransferase-like domain-containing protein [Lapillicoccus sp.]|nr:Type 1 glutamine amidotransferase-like domain-containing protein [Lapillicoccus sp.]